MKSVCLRRFGAYMIDVLIVGVISSCISFIPFLNPNREKYEQQYQEVLDLFQKYEQNEITQDQYQEQYIEMYYDLNRNSVNELVINIVVIIAYFGIFQWQMNGQTIGKRLLKIKVEANDPEKKLSWLNYFIRTIILNNIIITIAQLIVLFFIPKENFYAVYSNINMVGYILLYIIVFLILVRLDHRGLHDLIAGTKVVMIDENLEAEKTLKEEKVIEAEVQEVKKKKSIKSKK